MKKIYVLEGFKAYEGTSFLGAFDSKERAEHAKSLAEKILPRYDFDLLKVKEIVLHREIPAWKTWLKRKWLCRRFKRRP
jgi:hypothetical protein